MRKIVFVCTGNTCRSPMAEIIMKNKVKSAGITDVRVTSAGLSATTGDKINPKSFAALKGLGLKPYGFKSKPLTKKLIKSADAIICMTISHKNYLSGYENVTTISELTGLSDVLDPYGQSAEIYMETARQLNEACEIILNKIVRKEGD